MTVLRSRKTLTEPANPNKNQETTVQPVTPARTRERNNHQSHPELTPRRRSLRLASKSVSGECVGEKTAVVQTASLVSGRGSVTEARRGKRKLNVEFDVSEPGNEQRTEVSNEIVENGGGDCETVVEKKVEIDMIDVSEVSEAHGKPKRLADKGKRVMEDVSEEEAPKRRARYTREDKGKAKLVEDEIVDTKVEIESKSSFSESVSEAVNLVEAAMADLTGKRVESRTEQFRDFAKQNASRFAHFKAEQEDVNTKDENETSDEESEKEIEDWPGPFATAMRVIRDRENNVNLQQKPSTFSDKKESEPLLWVPKTNRGSNPLKVSPPSLQELSLKLLVKNADAITSLDYVPEALKHKLCRLLCDSRRMNDRILDLLVRGYPTEIRLWDCSWLTEEHFTKCFSDCNTSNLTVLQLDQCGRCMPDYVLLSSLARTPNNLPVLTTLSLAGACRLSDVGLRAIVSAAPALKSINLSQCSLLTAASIDALADSLGSVLRELFINDCESMEAMVILPALNRLENLEVLSMAGNETVSNRFIKQFVTARGCNMKELTFTNCLKLRDSSVKAIAENCPQLCALDLVNLSKLTDSALVYLANGCRSLQTLKLSRNGFSDEAIAAFLETSGEFLKELSLNNIKKVGRHTALSLAKRLRNLHTLDLSWCRDLSDEAVGLIVDSCLSLRVLKLFGCTQITNLLLDGHSNPNIHIIGLKLSSVVNNIQIPDSLAAPLHYSCATSVL